MMKNLILALAAGLAMCQAAMAQKTAQDQPVDVEDIHLEVITPAEPVQEAAQEIKDREARLRSLNDDVAHAKAANSLRRGYFVLLADNIQLGNRYYKLYDINSNSNFVLAQGDDGILQYALNTGAAGSNGLGGWTGKGTVRDKRLTTAAGGDVFLQYNLVGPNVNTTVHITLFGGSNRAVARIMGGPDITIYGEILPYRDAKHR